MHPRTTPLLNKYIYCVYARLLFCYCDNWMQSISKRSFINFL